MATLTVLGSDGMARAVAIRALAGGHSVQILGRDAARVEELAGALRPLAGEGATVTTGAIGEPLAGELEAAQTLEAFQFLHITLQFSRGTGFRTAIKLLG